MWGVTGVSALLHEPQRVMREKSSGVQSVCPKHLWVTQTQERLLWMPQPSEVAEGPVGGCGGPTQSPAWTGTPLPDLRSILSWS